MDEENKYKKKKKFLELPEYPGGKKAFKEFIRKNLKYPAEAAEKGIEGDVFLHFEVNHEGKVTDAKVAKGIGYGCDEEALRLIKLLQFKKAKNRGVRVKTNHKAKIGFKKEMIKAGKQPTTINYSYTKKAKEKSKKSSDSGYGYTISF